MKKIGVIFALSLYIWGLAAPFLPLVDYVVKYDYYVNVLCVNKDKPELACKGQCILMQKLQAEAEKQKPSPVTFNPEEELSFYVVGFFNPLFVAPSYNSPTTYESFWEFSWVNSPPTPPPRV